MTDSIRKLMEEQESLRRLYEPPEYIQRMFEEQESLRKLYEPPEYIQRMIEAQESLWRLYEPPEYIQRMIKEQESLRKLYEPPEYIQRMIEEQESLRKLYEPPEYIQRLIEEHENFREIFAPAGAVATAFQSLLNKNNFQQLDITEIKGLAEELSATAFHVNNDGSLSLNNQVVGLSELSITVGNFFEQISGNLSKENILYNLDLLKAPAKRIAIWILNHIFVAFVVSVMAGILTPNIQDLINSSELNSKREVTYAIKQLPTEINLDEFKCYRVVTAKILNLRQKPSMKSIVITEINRGKLVHVIQKKKNWTKVEVEISNTTDRVVGWVATRYIAPLKR